MYNTSGLHYLIDSIYLLLYGLLGVCSVMYIHVCQPVLDKCLFVYNICACNHIHFWLIHCLPQWTTESLNDQSGGSHLCSVMHDCTY